MSKNQSEYVLQVVTYLPHLLLAGDYDDDDGEDGDSGDGHGQCHVHILNSGAFSLVLVEKSFLAIFSANQKVRMVGFFSWTVLYEGHNLFLKYPASKFQLSR